MYTLNFEILIYSSEILLWAWQALKILRLQFQCLTRALGTLNFEIFKASLAKRSSERLTLGTLKFENLLWTFQF